MTDVARQAGVSERATSGGVSDALASPLADACEERFCGCGCGASLAGMRADALYRSEACSKRAKRARSTDKARTRRPSRNGRGTRLYVLSDEIELVRDLLAGKPAGSTRAADRLLRKIPRALERIEGRAA